MVKRKMKSSYGRYFKPRTYAYEELDYPTRKGVECRLKKNYHFVIYNSDIERIVFHSKNEPDCFKWLQLNPQASCRILRWYSEKDLFEGLEDRSVN